MKAKTEERREARCRDLQPCPFCGSGVATYMWGVLGTRLRFFKCTNKKCGATISFDNKECNTQPEKAIEKYNNRFITR